MYEYIWINSLYNSKVYNDPPSWPKKILANSPCYISPTMRPLNMYGYYYIEVLFLKLSFPIIYTFYNLSKKYQNSVTVHRYTNEAMSRP